MSSFSLYVLGYAVLLAGLAYGAHLLDVPRSWIIVGALIIGLGVMSAVTHTKPKDPPQAPPQPDA